MVKPNHVNRALVYATCVPPSMVLHIAYHRLMVVVVRGHNHALSTHRTIIPDLPVLLRLVIAFIPRFVFYLLDIGYFKLQEPQRVFNEVSK